MLGSGGIPRVPNQEFETDRNRGVRLTGFPIGTPNVRSGEQLGYFDHRVSN